MEQPARDRLSPAQLKAATEVRNALRFHPVVQLKAQTSSDGGGLRPGAGLTTIYRALKASNFEDWSLISLGDVMLEEDTQRGGSGSFLTKVYNLARAMWAQCDTLLLDDLMFISGSNKIYSNRMTGSGQSHGFSKTGAEPSMLLKSLIDYALQHNKRLCFSSGGEEHFYRFTGAVFVVHLTPFTHLDYEHFFRLWLPSGYSITSAQVYEIYKQFPALTPAELRVVCVPREFASEANTETETEREGEGEGESLQVSLADDIKHNIATRLGESQGSLPLDKVENVDLTGMPGLDKILQSLELQVIQPFCNILDSESQFADPKAGVLLFGPPGTGKTSIGRHLAHRLKGKMFMVKEMFLWKELQQTFAKAEACAPSVIFFDDIDVLLHRSKVAWGGGSELFRFLLSKMDGMISSKGKSKKFVTIIMTCESPKSLPDALIRSGRIELWLKTEYPKGKQRAKILKKLLKEQGQKVPDLLTISDRRINQIADRTEDFSPADLRRVIQDARNILASAKETAAVDKVEESEEMKESHNNNEKKKKKKKLETPDEVLERACEDLRRMRDEVESFMKQMYQ